VRHTWLVAEQLGALGRLHYSVVTLAALGTVWYLHAVDLLGFRI
jgi:hypothetical protein